MVRDRGGHTVPDLRKSNFRLYDNGRLEHIADFGANAVPIPDPSAAGTVRYTALYFDDLHYDFAQTIRVTDSAYAAFGSTLSPRHKIGVFTASGQVQLDFTGDREKFHHSLLAIKPHLDTKEQAKICPEITDYEAYLLIFAHDPFALKIAFDDMQQCEARAGVPDPPPSMADMRRMKIVAEAQAKGVIQADTARSARTLDGLSHLIDTMSRLPDPRGIIVASPGFLTGTLGQRVDQLARRAAQQHIIVSTLNSAGLVQQIPFPASAGHSREASERVAIIATRNQWRADRAAATSDPLTDLAAMTAGNFITNMDDLDDGFRDAAPLPRDYYVLGYFPHRLRHDGEFHTIRVDVVGKRGMGVQAPDGYFAPGSPEEIANSSLRGRHRKHRSSHHR